MSVVRRTKSRTMPLALGALAVFGAITVLVALWFSDAQDPGVGAIQSTPLARDANGEQAMEAREPVIDAPQPARESALESTHRAPERVETTAPPPELLVSVYRGDLDRALPLAEVWLLDEFGARTWSAWTDDEGQCLVPSAARLGAVFVQARAKNYFEAVEPLAPTAREVRLVLASATLGGPIHLSGVVERDSGGSAGAGVWVLLTFGQRQDPSADDVERLISGEYVRGLEITRTDAQGGFSFEVDSLAGPFGLLAGARGWSTRFPKETKEGAYAVLRLSRLHGARVKLLDGESEVDANAAVRSRAATLQLASAASTLSLSDATLVLAGVSATELEREPKAVRCVLHDPTADERSGPHRLALHLPGFLPATHDFEARPLEFGFADSEVRLVRTAAGFGRLRVQLGEASPAVREAMHNVTLTGVVFLRGQGDKHATFECTLSLERPAWIENVPYGAHELEFVSPGLRLVSPRRVLVNSPESEALVSLAACGAARLRLRSRDSSVINEALECSLTWRSDALSGRGSLSGSTNTRLRAAPRVLAPLMAGEYQLHNPRLEHGETSGSVPFVVRLGELTEVEITVGP